jgi:hypothetical protein
MHQHLLSKQWSCSTLDRGLSVIRHQQSSDMANLFEEDDEMKLLMAQIKAIMYSV